MALLVPSIASMRPAPRAPRPAPSKWLHAVSAGQRRAPGPRGLQLTAVCSCDGLLVARRAARTSNAQETHQRRTSDARASRHRCAYPLPGREQTGVRHDEPSLVSGRIEIKYALGLNIQDKGEKGENNKQSATLETPAPVLEPTTNYLVRV